MAVPFIMNNQGPLQSIGSPAIWVAYTDNLHDDLLQHAFHTVLSQPEKEKNLRYKHDHSRKLHLVARLITRCVLTQYAPEVAPAQWHFEPNPHGKPSILSPHALAGKLHFNVSHTSGIVVLAVSGQGPVGVDVEPLNRPVDHLQLAGRYFAAAECEALNQCPMAERAALFYRIWTLKEAYVKALGTGLAHPLDTFWFSPVNLAEPQPRLVTIEPAQGTATTQSTQALPGHNWHAHVVPVGPGHPWVISVVHAVPEPHLHQAQYPWPIHEFKYNPA